MGLPILKYKGIELEFSELLCFSVPESCFNLSKSVDLDEMPHFAAFHLGLHFLPKYPFRGF